MLSYLSHLKKFCDFDSLLDLKRKSIRTYQFKNAVEFLEIKKDFLQATPSYLDLEASSVSVGKKSDLSDKDYTQLKKNINDLIPWKKGPFNFFGEEINTEWRSDFKWDRIEPYLKDIKGKRVLDIGCNNGYFMFKMAQYKPELVLGIDPVVDNIMQFDFAQNFLKLDNLKFELWGVEDLHHFHGMFDTVLSMGIIYHHRHPIKQLLDIREALAPGGKLILETIGIPGDTPVSLTPEDRYAKMRNVWFVPTMSCLINWAKRAHFKNIEIVSDTILDNSEQRLTDYCPPPFQSLDDFLDPNDSSKTIEGYPAPRRFCIIATK